MAIVGTTFTSKESHNSESASVISAMKAESISPYSFQLLKKDTQ